MGLYPAAYFAVYGSFDLSHNGGGLMVEIVRRIQTGPLL